jgi:hypothetical protein
VQASKPYKIGTEVDYEIFELTNQFRTDPNAFVDWIQEKYNAETDELSKNFF